MDLIQDIVARAKANKQRIVLPEGTEERTLKAADRVLADQVADIVLIGDPAEIKNLAERWGLTHISEATIVNPKAHEKKAAYADLLFQLRQKKGMTPEKAAVLVEDPLYLGCLMIKAGDADGEIAGAENTTGNVDSGVSYGTEDTMTQATNYYFYVKLDDYDGLMLGQHVYIEHDTGLSQREPGVWLNEAFIADLDKKPYVWAEKDGALEKRTVVLGTYDQEMMQYKIEDGIDSGDYVAYPQEFLEEGMKTTHDPAQAYAGEMEEPSGEEIPLDEEISEETLPEGTGAITEEETPQEETIQEPAEGENSSPEL